MLVTTTITVIMTMSKTKHCHRTKPKAVMKCINNNNSFLKSFKIKSNLKLKIEYLKKSL